MIKLFTPAEIKSVSKEGENDTYEVLVSSGKVDRLGDTIDPKGWYLKNYNKNPVILWAHQSGGFGQVAVPPVGQALKTWVKDGKELWQKQIFAPTPLGQELKTLVDGEFLRAQSVGFLPLVEDGEKGDIDIEGKMYRRIFDEELRSYIEKGFVAIAGKTYSRDGQHFDKQELLEVSWVCVPALPTALVAARKMNLALITKALEEIETKEECKECKKDLEEIAEIRPYPGEHSCRLESPDKYDRFARKNCEAKHDGKCIDYIYGIKEGKSELQAMRYDKEIWTASAARSHCKDHDGSFEAASEEQLDDISTKEGRVISEKNRTLINNSIKQMGIAIDALRELLKATEPEKGVAPNAKGRSHDEVKDRINPTLHLMRLADKAVENALSKLKETKLNSKTEIRLLRIASKVVDTAIIKAKAKK